MALQDALSLKDKEIGRLGKEMADLQQVVAR